MDPKWCQNVTQDGSFHGTEDGVCGYLFDFGRLVAAHFHSYRDKAKTPSSHLLGAHFGHQTWQKYGVLMWFKTVFVVILGVQKFVKMSPIKPFKGPIKPFKGPIKPFKGAPLEAA